MRLHENTSNYFALRDTTLNYITSNNVTCSLSHTLSHSLSLSPFLSVWVRVGVSFFLRGLACCVIVFAVFRSVCVSHRDLESAFSENISVGTRMMVNCARKVRENSGGSWRY